MFSKQPTFSSNQTYQSPSQKRLKTENEINPKDETDFKSNKTNSDVDTAPSNTNNNNYLSNSINSIYNNEFVPQPSETQTDLAEQEFPDGQADLDENLLITSLNADQILEQQKLKLKSKSTVKMKTFFGGEEIKDFQQFQKNHQQLSPSLSTKSKPNTNANSVFSSTSSIDYFNFEFIGAGVKLEKSILIINNNSVSKQSKKRISHPQGSILPKWLRHMNTRAMNFCLKKWAMTPTVIITRKRLI